MSRPDRRLLAAGFALVLGAAGAPACTQTFIRQQAVETGHPVPRPEVDLRLLDGAGQWRYPAEVRLRGRLLERGNLGCAPGGNNSCRHSLMFEVEDLEGAEGLVASKAEVLLTLAWDDLPRVVAGESLDLRYSLRRPEKGMPTLDLELRGRDGRLAFLLHSGNSAAEVRVAGLLFKRSAGARYFSDRQFDLGCRIKRTHNFTTVLAEDRELGIWVPGESRRVELDGRSVTLHILDNSTVRGGSCDELSMQEQAHLSFVINP